MSKFTIEQQMPFYTAFFGQRVAISHINSIRRDFTKMIETFKDDLEYYHKDVDSKQLREALIVGLQVLHRLEAKHPNVYTKSTEIGLKAFKHADRYLQGKPLPLPPIRDEEEIWDREQARQEDRYKKTREKLDSMNSPEITEEQKESGNQGFRKIREILGGNRKDIGNA